MEHLISRLIGRVQKTVDYNRELHLASKEPEYAVFVRACLLAVSPFVQGWGEKYNRTESCGLEQCDTGR